MSKPKMEQVLEEVIEGHEATDEPATVDDAVPGTRPRGAIPSGLARKIDELSREIGKISTAGERRAERSAAFAARPKAPTPISPSAVGKQGGTRADLTLDLPASMSREDAMKPEALRLVASLPTLHRSEKMTLGLGCVGSRFDVQAEDLSWGERWLVISHVPAMATMAVWPIPNTYWERPTETTSVTFEEYEFRDLGIHGWRIHRARDGVLMTDTPFASADLARSYVLTTLREKAIS